MFVLEEKRYIEEIMSQCFIYRHPCGARLMHIKNEDDNKVFYAAFPTPCENDKGIPHIVEHCVLAGSKRYPVKDPFHEMSKSSFHTYLNALTYSDKTVYPVASVSLQDFTNLVKVYLDAVFCPLLREETFLREGGPDGIVYNEMSGVYSDPSEFLKTQGYKALFPNTPYRFDAGGVPEAIRTLGYQEFLDYYRERYQPANCCFYFYGNMEIEEYCSYIHETYLASFPVGKENRRNLFEREKSFDSAVLKTVDYHFSSNPRQYLYVGRVMRTCHDFMSKQGLRVLMYYLLGMQSSPLKRAVLDAGLGQEVQYGFHGDGLQAVSEITVYNSSGELARLIEAEEKTLGNILNKGLDKDTLGACLAKFDFAFRDHSGYRPKGLVLGLRVLEAWLHEGSTTEELFCRMSPLRTLEELKKKGEGYFLKLLQTELIDNAHAAYLKLIPSQNNCSERSFSHSAKVPEILQTTPDTEESLQTIPFVGLPARLAKEPEVYNKVEKIPFEEKNITGLKTLFHPMDTNGIVYMDIFFNTDKLPTDMISGLQALTYVLGKLATEKYDVRELSRLLSRYFGGFAVSFEVFQKSLTDYHPKIMIKIKCLSEDLPKVLDILKEILCNTLFQEAELHKLLLELESKTRNQIVNEGQRPALTRLLSYFSEGGRYKEKACGLSLLFPGAEKSGGYLQSVARACITRENVIMSLTCRQEDYERYSDEFRRFYEELPQPEAAVSKAEALFTLEEGRGNEAFITATKVQYVTAGWEFQGIRHGGITALAVHILEAELLMEQVRIVGGAYGCHCHFLPSGILYFYSYRDPHLQRTLEVYEKAFSFLQNFHPRGQEMDKYKIGALNPYLRPRSNEEKGRMSSARYFMNISHEDLERERKELLEAEASDIRQLGHLMSASAVGHRVCVNGSERAVRESQRLFDDVIIIE